MSRAYKIVIDGEHYATVHALCSVAMTRGFTGKRTTLENRLRRGATTWAELLAPVDQSRVGNATKRAAHRAEEKALMAQLCAELDARKAALKEAA